MNMTWANETTVGQHHEESLATKRALSPGRWAPTSTEEGDFLRRQNTIDAGTPEGKGSEGPITVA